jgi:hypothetical protein
MDVILIRNGLVENVISADSVERALLFYPDHIAIKRTAELSFVGPGHLYDGTTFTAPPEPEPPASTDRRITKLRFQLRFTDQEAVAIDMASRGDTPEAALLRRHRELVQLAEWVDLGSDLTRNGVLGLAAMGLLTPERAAEILDTPVADDERPV